MLLVTHPDEATAVARTAVGVSSDVEGVLAELEAVLDGTAVGEGNLVVVPGEAPRDPSVPASVLWSPSETA